MAASKRGVCAILFGAEAVELTEELKRRFPRADFVKGGPEVEAMLREAVALADAPGKAWTLPLDARGTAFQKAVWKTLRGIPSGTTVSYAEVARRVGRPRAVRAVGQAIGANPLAVVVPCHRVLRGDGSIGGYRWGVERKRALLEREARA